MNKKHLIMFVVVLFSLLVNACGPSAEQVATMTASAWTVTPSATATFTPTLTSTPTSTPTLTPTITPTPTQIPLDQLEGTWSGRMEKEGTVQIEVKDGKITYLELNFTQSGCESVTPFAMAMLSQPQPIENNSFVIEMFSGELSGTFTLDGIIGTLQFELFTCKIDTTFTAEQ